MNFKAYQETLQTCPYDPSHRILCHRFSTHLVKCRRNHPNSTTSVCPFNACHVVPTPELTYHAKICTDRGEMDRFRTETDDNQPKIEVNFDNDPVIENAENWDTDSPCYDPAEYCANNMILRRLDIASKAKRRDFRESERLRFQELEVTSEPQQRHVPRAPRSEIPLPLVAAQPREEMPLKIATHLREIATGASCNPPPLSDILSAARAAVQQEDSWQQVPARGRGRGIRDPKK